MGSVVCGFLCSSETLTVSHRGRRGIDAFTSGINVWTSLLRSLGLLNLLCRLSGAGGKQRLVVLLGLDKSILECVGVWGES